MSRTLASDFVPDFIEDRLLCFLERILTQKTRDDLVILVDLQVDVVHREAPSFPPLPKTQNANLRQIRAMKVGIFWFPQ